MKWRVWIPWAYVAFASIALLLSLSIAPRALVYAFLPLFPWFMILGPLALQMVKSGMDPRLTMAVAALVCMVANFWLLRLITLVGVEKPPET